MREREPEIFPEDSESFENQFSNPEIKEIYGGKIEVYATNNRQHYLKGKI